MKFRDLLLEAQVDPEVEKVQRILLNRGHYLGNTGVNRDGIDGVLGPLTKAAYQEYYGKPYPSSQARHLAKSKNIIVSEPPFPTNDNSVCVVFGGISYATPSWMMQQVPKNLLDKKTFAFVPYTSSIGQVESELMGKKIKSVVGFSAGGHKVWPLCGQYEFVGLIDPSTKDSYIKNYFINDKRVVMMFNNENWGGRLSYIGDEQMRAKDIMGGNAIKVNMGHSKIPKAFFERFGSFM
jgi:hypothetical protein